MYRFQLIHDLEKLILLYFQLHRHIVLGRRKEHQFPWSTTCLGNIPLCCWNICSSYFASARSFPYLFVFILFYWFTLISKAMIKLVFWEISSNPFQGFGRVCTLQFSLNQQPGGRNHSCNIMHISVQNILCTCPQSLVLVEYQNRKT